ncbi:MAG: hypothetical protein M1828_006660 [Chrysothrix sp. TS-e1954]|nr:MAG: hypothetical protein M1828_006660 [Chrysothrix sp. TS-e1954]
MHIPKGGGILIIGTRILSTSRTVVPRDVATPTSGAASSINPFASGAPSEPTPDFMMSVSTHLPAASSTYLPTTSSTYLPGTSSTHLPATSSTHLATTLSTYLATASSTHVPEQPLLFEVVDREMVDPELANILDGLTAEASVSEDDNDDDDADIEKRQNGDNNWPQGSHGDPDRHQSTSGCVIWRFGRLWCKTQAQYLRLVLKKGINAW